ncbi:uncharacterized protein LOC131303478 [Rhododendron vialii]|uniref:uncharacterized protein LOC131303478 n=1 Tax=Rhododendron vialii TaxID=182163 RepID=UPI00265E7EF4|nr:uncharacterized protein LOC131303478 [Rhododendron vialii]
MRREGRQHGMVRNYPILGPPFNPRPESRYLNRFDSPPTAGLFTKVSSKPTNHSKFTGICGRPKCTGCHAHPVSKSRPKAKGTQKLRSCDVVSNHRLVSWRVVDSNPGLKFSGFSAGGILDHLDRDNMGDFDDDDDDFVGEVYEDSCELDHRKRIGESTLAPRESHDSVELEIASGAVDIKDCDEEKKDDDENENVSIDDLEIVWAEELEDEDWCLVAEM